MELTGDVQLIIPLVEAEVVLVTAVRRRVCVDRRRGMLTVIDTASVCELAVSCKWLRFEILPAVLCRNGGLAKDGRDRRAEKPN